MDLENLARSENPDGVDLVEVYTLANAITLVRLFMVPVFFALLLKGGADRTAFWVFAIAASTDWLDGQIARRTKTVSVVGRAIDPLVDRLLIAAGVLGLYLIDRIPLWIVLVLFARDVLLLTGSFVLEKRHSARMPVKFLGKVTTAVLLAGFCGLLWGWGWAIEVVYAGVVLSVTTAVLYVREYLRFRSTNIL